MRTLRFLTLLGLCISVGAALAIGLALGVSTPPLAGPLPGPKPVVPLATRTAEAPKKQSPVVSESAPKPSRLEPMRAPVAAPETAPMPPETLTVRVLAPIAGLAPDVPDTPGPEMRQVLQKIYRSLVGPLSGVAVAPPPPPPAEAVPAPPPIPDPNGPVVVPPAEPAPVMPQGQITQTPGDGEGDMRLRIEFKDADIREVLDCMAAQANLNIVAGRSVQGKVSVRLSDVDVQGALDAILRSTGFLARRDGRYIYVGTPEECNQIEQSFYRIGTRVYRPNYVGSAELQALVQPLLTDKVGVVSVSAPPEIGIQSDNNAAGGNKYAGGDVIVVRDYEAVLDQIDQVVAEIDVRPLQVAIEAMILSVKLDDADKLGMNWQFLRDHPNLKFALGTPAQTLPATFTTGGLQFAFLDSNLGAFVDALQEIKETNVIATPRLMVINKQRAEIQIGKQEGYINTTITETSSSQSVAFMDTGTILRLRPYVSSDGAIRMEVHPEISSGEVRETAAGFTIPNKDVTQVTTNVMVRDGCTVIIGGLMGEQLETEGNQVPFFGDLPLVGPLFRNRSQKVNRHEILVMITPHIVYEPDTCLEGEKGACEFHRRQAVVAEKMNPLGKRYVARRYFRLAQNAWAAGDRAAAMHYAEWAVQFDPQNRAYIDLRSTIWQGQPYGRETLQQPPCCPAGNPLDGPEIAGWLLDDLEREPVAQPAPQHPLDPGRPGGSRDVDPPRRLQ